MADKKVTELTALTSASRDDLLLIVNDPSGTPESRKITIGNFFSNVVTPTTFKSNTAFTGTTVSFTANTFVKGTNILNAVNDRIQIANAAARYANSRNTILTGRTTAINVTANSVTITATKGMVLSGVYGAPASSNAAVEGVAAGTIFYSNNFIYIATDANTIKRIQLDAF
jgi:hypothetical protein